MGWLDGFRKGKSGAAGVEQQKRELTRDEEALDQVIGDVERALGIWKRWCLEKESRMGNVAAFDAFAARLSKAKTTAEVSALRGEIEVFIQRVRTEHGG
jgi:hypothetical protein